MRGLSGIVFFVAFLAFLQAEKYTSKWDNIDIDEILHSDRLLGNYKNCLMEKGKCTPEGTELKKNLPDALKTECSKCTAKQKVNTEKVVNYMIEHKKDWWEELQSKYDPAGIYYSKYLEKKKAEEGMKPQEEAILKLGKARAEGILKDKPKMEEEPKMKEEPKMTEEPKTKAEPKMNEEPTMKEKPKMKEEPTMKEEPKVKEEEKTKEEPKMKEEEEDGKQKKV